MDFAVKESVQSALLSNPFYVLGAATRDGRAKIAELAEDRMLTLDPDVCQKARAELSAPRSRLTAEIGWLPGVSPRRAKAAIDSLSDESPEVSTSKLPPLARANVLAAKLEGRSVGADEVVSRLSELASASEEIDADVVMRDINEDRSVAGIPPALDLNLIQSELAAMRRRYRDVARRVLDQMPTRTLVKLVGDLADKATSGGRMHASILVQNIIDDYEVAAQPFIEVEVSNLEKVLGLIRSRIPQGERAVIAEIETLRALLSNWSHVVGPIMLVGRARGLSHQPSMNVAFGVRSLSIELYNEHGFCDAATKITESLQSNFPISGSSPNGSPRTHQRLPTSTAPGSQARKDKAEFERSLYYSAEIGAVFKSRVQISADGFFWKDQKFKLEDVTRLRWGGTKHSVNGIPTGTTYDILVATPHASASLNFRGEAIFTALVDRLWRGVGVRLLYSYAEYLKKGGRLTFPGAVIEDEAMAKVLEADNAHPLFS